MIPNIICKVLFGSHLYGTDTPDSDMDYKGVFLPSIKDLILQRVPKTINLSTNKTSEKNTKDDVDYELYSLPYFLELACQGETVALDMLHAPTPCVLSSSATWEQIVSYRRVFYTRNLKSFVGYARKQAAKYGLKGSRLNEAKDFIDLLAKYNPFDKMETIWEGLEDREHSRHIADNPQGVKQYQICGKVIQSGTKIGYSRNIIKGFYAKFGHRAELAAKNEGIDWKAISHALRAAYQVKSILLSRTITFPLPEADYLKQVKTGQLDYMSNVGPKLERLMEEVELLSLGSDLPEKVNRDFWDNMLLSFYGVKP